VLSFGSIAIIVVAMLVYLDLWVYYNYELLNLLVNDPMTSESEPSSKTGQPVSSPSTVHYLGFALSPRC
jgi:hypothetical protein